MCSLSPRSAVATPVRPAEGDGGGEGMSIKDGSQGLPSRPPPPSTAHMLGHHVPWSAPAARWARWPAPASVRPPEAAAAARVPSVSGPNDYVALRGTSDDRIGWIKGRLVFLYYPNGRRALVPVRTAPRSPRRRGLKQALRAPAGGVVADPQRPSCARLWTVRGESWGARGPGVP